MAESTNKNFPLRRLQLSVALLMSVTVGCVVDSADVAERADPLHGNFASRIAIDALGGAGSLADLESYSVVAGGQRAIRGEGLSAGDDPVPASQFSKTFVRDLRTDSLRINRQAIDQFPFPSTRDFSEVIVGPLGYIVGIDNAFGLPPRPMLSDRWASVRKQHRLLNPHELVRVLLDEPRRARFAGIDVDPDGVRVRIALRDDVAPIILHIDVVSGELEKLTTRENSHLARDTALEVVYVDWQAVDGSGIRFPQAVTLLLGGELIHAEERASIAVNGVVDDTVFDFPPGPAPLFDAELAARGETSHQFNQQFTSLGLPTDGVQTFILPIELAPGVTLLGGGSHNSLIVEHEARVIVSEAPLYEARSEAIISWVRQNIPGKPISHVISSHHHADHSAGLRRFVAEGATVILGAPSARFFHKDVFRARSSISPDALAKDPRPAKIRRVRDSRSLSDASRPIDIYRVESSHADDMLVVHLPEQRLLLTSDIFSPGGFNVAQWLIELDGELRRLDLDLDIEVIAGVHGQTATWEEFEQLVAAEGE